MIIPPSGGSLAIGGSIGGSPVSGSLLYADSGGALAQIKVTGLVKGTGSTYTAAAAGTDYPGLATANSFTAAQTVTSTTNAFVQLTSTSGSGPGRSYQMVSGSDGQFAIWDATAGVKRWTLDLTGNIGLGSGTSAAARLLVPGAILIDRNGLPHLAMNSAGTNYGFLQNDAADTWSLATGTDIASLGTAIIKWTKLAAVTISTSGGSIGFYGVTPIARAVLATGAAHTVDDVITALQNLGLVKQS